MGVSINGGTLIADGWFYGKSQSRIWMMTRGTPSLGNPHMLMVYGIEMELGSMIYPLVIQYSYGNHCICFT